MSIELSPENNVYIRLNRFNHLKSPKICLSLDSSDDPKGGELSPKGGKCKSCETLKRLVCVKDIAINRLTEDRLELKLRLTEINNKNIELKQRLKRFESERHERHDRNDNHLDLKNRYEELEAINGHLRQHLNTLRQVFNDLHNSSESTGNETTTTATTNTVVQSVTKTETKSQSTSTEDKTDINLNNDNSRVDDSLDQSLDKCLKSSFDKWYNK